MFCPVSRSARSFVLYVGLRYAIKLFNVSLTQVIECISSADMD
jgi:hypothetical protein